MINFRRIFLLAIYLLLFNQGQSQAPYLADSRAEAEESLRTACKYLNEEQKRNFGRESVASVIASGDTLTWSASTDDEAELRYLFSENKVISMNVRLSCLSCLNLTYRKWLFKGSWRVDQDGYLYRSKDPARASIRRAVDCPYLYEVKLESLENPPSKDEFKKMEKVKKKRIGTRKYILREE